MGPPVVAIAAKKAQNGMCYRLDLKSQKFINFPKIPESLQDDFSSLCATPKGFALTGGPNGRCVQYQSATATWGPLPNLPLRTCENASLWIRNKLFSIGGRVHNFGFERPGWRVFFLHSDGKWHQGPALPRRMSFPLVATLDGSTAYVLHRTTGELFFLDLGDILFVDWIDIYVKSIWKRAYTVPIQKATGMVALGERLYVHGDDVTGYYEPGTATWCQIRPPSQHQVQRPLVCHGGKLYLFGEEVEEYDPDAEEQKWIRKWTMNNSEIQPGHKIAVQLQ